jgi:5'-nucleotidase
MILLSNDDGVNADGLAMLAESLMGRFELEIAAPLRNRSGIGHAVTFDRPIEVVTMPPFRGTVKRVAIDGTPADAVKFAIKHHLDNRPELVVTGVNNGPNVGVNILYSGTVGAAFEALIHGICAVATSVEHNRPADPEAVSYYINQVVDMAFNLINDADASFIPFCLNLNIPSLPLKEIKGLRVCKQGISGFDESFHQVGENTFQIDGPMTIRDPDEYYDAAALQAGYATVTPLWINFAHPEIMKKLSINPDIISR